MGYRDVLNQLKGMKPLAKKAVKKLSQVAMAPAVMGIGAGLGIKKMNKPMAPARSAKPAPRIHGYDVYKAGAPKKKTFPKMERMTPMPMKKKMPR
jgi:hypothetical protein